MNLVLRPATKEDVKLLLDWSNDPIVRANSKNTNFITWEAHIKWVESKLRCPQSTQIFIAVNKYAIPVGQIRFDRNGIAAILTYSVAEEYRNKGMGTLLLIEGIKKISDVWQDLKHIHAIAKDENLASRKTLEKSGFEFSRSYDGYSEYTMKIIMSNIEVI